MIVWRSVDGSVINIGPWDFLESTGDDGVLTVGNPLPDGATFSEEEVVQAVEEGGLYVPTDHRILDVETVPITGE